DQHHSGGEGSVMRPLRAALLVSIFLVALLMGSPEVPARAAQPAGAAHDVSGSDLAAWWPFDEHDGAEALNLVTGMSDPVQDNFGRPEWREGVVGNALFFDG